MTPMSIRDCEAFAKKNGFDSTSFLAIFPAGPRQCKWIDAYFGFFRIDGIDGFVRTDDIAEAYPGLICLPIPPDEQAERDGQ